MSAKTEAVRSTRAGSVSAYMEMHQSVSRMSTMAIAAGPSTCGRCGLGLVLPPKTTRLPAHG